MCISTLALPGTLVDVRVPYASNHSCPLGHQRVDPWCWVLPCMILCVSMYNAISSHIELFVHRAAFIMRCSSTKSTIQGRASSDRRSLVRSFVGLHQLSRPRAPHRVAIDESLLSTLPACSFWRHAGRCVSLSAGTIEPWIVVILRTERPSLSRLLRLRSSASAHSSGPISRCTIMFAFTNFFAHVMNVDSSCRPSDVTSMIDGFHLAHEPRLLLQCSDEVFNNTPMS